MHFPDSEYALKNARNRLAYQDFFEFILMMQMSKEQRVTAKNQFTFEENGIVEQIISKLPYPLTGAQKRTIDCIHNEMRGDYVMPVSYTHLFPLSYDADQCYDRK